MRGNKPTEPAAFITNSFFSLFEEGHQVHGFPVESGFWIFRLTHRPVGTPHVEYVAQ